MEATILIGAVQLFFTVVIGLYFWNQLRSQYQQKGLIQRDSQKELEALRRMRRRSLTVPLAEKTRPASFDEIVGQEEGLRALRAALCGSHPQHVLIYGPPGVGKTAAARLVLEEAKKNPDSPFGPDAQFVEVDATIARFDERGIADPLLGSVHDPIYQGAGALGQAGIPQPKPGAVTKAHGGILFLDEIGELHPIQMNKLLKVLEDRKVFLESAYYHPEDKNIPEHIHDIFQNGLPADFRLVGATTRLPEEIPAALRSRCVEIHFRPLNARQIRTIAERVVRKAGLRVTEGALDVLVRYAKNGREAVNLLQIAMSMAQVEKKEQIEQADVEWVIANSQLPVRVENRVSNQPRVGLANGLAVCGPSTGMLIEVEVAAIPCSPGKGRLVVTGMMDEEELGVGGRKLRRRSMSMDSLHNVLTVLRLCTGVCPQDYDLHINIPGGVPIDGPSAGVTLATAIYSAITQRPVDNRLAMTGELGIRGQVKPVGGILNKLEAAREAGVQKVLIPRDNWQEMLKSQEGIEIVPVEHIGDVFHHAMGMFHKREGGIQISRPAAEKWLPSAHGAFSSEVT